MKNRIPTHDLLLVYELIQRFGTKIDTGYQWQGITASSDYDGYTVFLCADGVSMQLGFHHTYHLDYQHARQFDAFQKRITALLKKHKHSLNQPA